jgi:hypothetical protein
MHEMAEGALQGGDFRACRSRGMLTLFRAFVVTYSPVGRLRRSVHRCADLPGEFTRHFEGPCYDLHMTFMAYEAP